LVWVTLEEVALDAVVEDGRLVARTSARQIADSLRLDPTTVAKALQTLRTRGLVLLEREKGPAGRFGLSVYALGPVPGLTLVSPGRIEPCTALPSVARPAQEEAVSASSGQPCRETPALALSDTDRPCVDPPDMDGSDVAAPDAVDTTPGRDLSRTGRDDGAPRARPFSATAPGSQCPGQGAFELGSVLA
jgi:DNA-binding transcriptional MocR family regulator